MFLEELLKVESDVGFYFMTEIVVDLPNGFWRNLRLFVVPSILRFLIYFEPKVGKTKEV